MKLYEINENVEQVNAILEGEDLTLEDVQSAFDTLDALEMEFKDKVENIIKLVKSKKYNIESLKNEENYLKSERQKVEKATEWLMKYLDENLKARGLDKSATYGTQKVSYRTAESVEVTDLASVPTEYLVFKDPTANKSEIKKALKAGEDIKGVELVTRKSLSITLGKKGAINENE